MTCMQARGGYMCIAGLAGKEGAARAGATELGAAQHVVRAETGFSLSHVKIKNNGSDA